MATYRSRAIAATIVAVAAISGVGGGLVAARIGEHGASPADGTTTPQTLSPKSGSPLYWADNVIHDGSKSIPFRPQYGSVVLAVDRTAVGWLVFEAIGQDGGRLVLVGRDGSDVPIPMANALYFDVSPGGDAVAVPERSGGTIKVFDPADRSVIVSVMTPLTETGNVRFAANDLIFQGLQGKTSEIVRYDASVDAIPTLHLTVPSGDATMQDVSPDGRYLEAEYMTQARACVAIFDLQASTNPLWRSCLFRASTGSSISPDGARMIVSPAVGDASAAPSLTIVDVKTGHPTNTLNAEHFYDAAWVDPGHVLVVSAVDRAETAFTVSECAIANDACVQLPGATSTHPVTDVAIGTNF